MTEQEWLTSDDPARMLRHLVPASADECVAEGVMGRYSRATGMSEAELVEGVRTHLPLARCGRVGRSKRAVRDGALAAMAAKYRSLGGGS